MKNSIRSCVLLLLVLMSAAASTAFAQVTTIVALTVNGGASVAIVNGQSITLEWYVVGSTNCSINNGVGPIDTSGGTSGSLTVVPPNNLSTDYILTCSTGSDTAEVDIKPTVSMTSVTGVPVSDDVRQATGSVLTGKVAVELRWQSEYATECTNIWFVREGENIIRWASNEQNRFADIGKTEGRILFSGWPNDSISTTTTYYIRCRNALTGSHETDQLTMRVLTPLPPPDLTLVATTTTPFVQQSTSTGFATANVYYSSQGATSCGFNAFTLDGTPIGVGGFTDRWSGRLSGNLNIGISTSTRFQIRCTRGAVGIYPATSTTQSVVVQIQNASGVVITATDLPVPTITALTATPTVISLDPITGYANTRLQYGTQHTTSCTALAYHLNGVEYSVANWSGALYGGVTRTVSIATSTRFTIHCVRSFDGATTSREFVIVTANPSQVVVNEPKTYVYANAVYYRASDMIRLQTSGSFEITNNDHALRDRNGDTRILKSSSSAVTPPVSITFPFNPAIASSTGTYDIQLRYCDESDGSSRYTISTQNSGVVGTWVSDAGTTSNSSASCDSLSFVTNLVAQNLTLVPGELITLSCTPLSGASEPCRVDTMYFGIPNEITVSLPPSLSTVTIPLQWISKNTYNCPFNEARAVAGNYTFAFNTGTQHYRTNAIATTTSFFVRCSRGDGRTDSSLVKVNVLPNVALTAQAGVISGDCIDSVTGLARTSEPWETVGVGGQCQLAVDLLAANPIVNQVALQSNNETGRYNNMQIGNVIANAGPGAVPAGESISYQTTITLQDGTVQTGPVQYYTSGIGAPVLGVPTETAPQITTFNNIPFGNHEICTTINVDPGSRFPESNLDTGNNTACIPFGLAVPEPDMTLTADKIIVRRGQTVELLASVPVTYVMNCRINGTGVESAVFTPPSETTNETESSSILNASLYQLSCTEPTTNSVFIREVLIEVVPTFEER